MSTPPDRLEPFELLKLMHQQKLDFSHEQVGALLAEVERTRAAVVEEREACAKVAEGWIAGGYRFHVSLAAAIRARGDGK